MLTRIIDTVSLDVTLVEYIMYSEVNQEIRIYLHDHDEIKLYNKTIDEYNNILKAINAALLTKELSKVYSKSDWYPSER